MRACIGTPYEDAIRHDNRGAAAVLQQAGGYRAGDPRLAEVVAKVASEAVEAEKEVCEPKIRHQLEHSQESSALRIVSTDLTGKIQERQAELDSILKRGSWAVKGLTARLRGSGGGVPSDGSFVKAAQHLQALIVDMRHAVMESRKTLDSDMNSEEAPIECLLWKKISTNYKKSVASLDNQMRGLLVIEKASRRIVKEIVKICKRKAMNDAEAVSSTKHGNSIRKQLRPGRAQRSESFENSLALARK